MSQKVAALVGISGVGKTTFLRSLALQIDFQHLTAGSLISAGRSRIGEERDGLRMQDISENQKLLISGFRSACDPTKDLIIMDGHVIIHGTNGLEIIQPQVFSALGIQSMIHLIAEPRRILENRSGDRERKRPELSEQELNEHQNISLREAQNICTTLGIPLLKITSLEIEKGLRFLQRSY